MKRGKRGQFYIIAAIIIITIFVGIAALRNYAKVNKEQVRIYDLGDELGIETGYVYDYGVYNEKDLDLLADDWTKEYIDYTKKQEVIENWIFIYGNENEITASTFSLVSEGTVEIIAGGGESPGVDIEVITKIKKEKIIPKGNLVSVKTPPEDFEYNFELKEGENFFFIITSEEQAVISKKADV